jgi:hypothetical protein
MNLLESTILLSEAVDADKLKTLKKATGSMYSLLTKALKKPEYEWTVHVPKFGLKRSLIWDSEAGNPVDLTESEIEKVRKAVAQVSEKFNVKAKLSIKKYGKQYRAMVVTIKL